MTKTFRDRLQKTTKAKSFIGRETELAFFSKLLEQDEPEYLILLVYGIGGVGKTWLLNQWETQVKEKNLPVARVNEEQTSVEQVLKKFRDDFVKQDFDFKEFDKSYQQFRQLKSEAEKALSQWEEKREEGLAQTAGRFTGKSVAVIAKLFTPSREALEFLGGSEKVEQAFAEGVGYLHKWFKSKEDLEFLENPLLQLTRSFAEDLNRICEKKRVVLFFDTYEYLSPFSDEWLCKTFLCEGLSDQIMLIFAGRDKFFPLWLDYQPLSRQIPLEVFTEEEAQTYLSSRDVTDPQIVDGILKTSGRLPVFLAMLTTQANGSAQDSGAPTETVVERFLKWIPKGESDKRRAVICCAFPRFFNKDLVQAIIGPDTSTGSGQDIFEWLHGLPFITSEKKRGWVYHKLVRTQILQYKYQESMQEYTAIHEKVLAYYRQNLRDETVVEELYHLLNIEAEKGIRFGLAGIFKAWIDVESWEEWIIKVDEVIRQVEKERNQGDQWGQIWKERLTQIFQKASESENTLKQLGEDEGLDPSARIGAYVTLGILLQNQQRIEEAEEAYRKAIDLNPNDATAYSNLGNLLQNQQRIEEAEEAYRKAIDLNPNEATAYSNLGNLLSDQQRIEEAEEAYRKAIDLNPENSSGYWNLGWMLYLMEKWEESIKVSRQGLTVDTSNAFIQFNIALALLCQGNVEEAKTEYQMGIEKSETKNLEAGITDLKEALKKRPDLPAAKEILSELERRFSQADC